MRWPYLRTAAPQPLARIRPLELAEQLGVPTDVMLDACLLAAREDLLVLKWDILCPTCRVPTASESLLSDIKKHTACEACDIEFQSNLGKAIELVFQAHPEIREVDQRRYCIGGPMHSPHVVTQVRLAAGEIIEMPMTLGSGDYVLRGRGLARRQPLRIRSSATPSQLDLRIGCLDESRHVPELRAGRVTIKLTNDLDMQQVIRVERTIERSTIFTAADASSLPRFRELFPEQTFRRDVPVATEQITLMATHVHNTAELYEQLGDSLAYELLQGALQEIEQLVSRHGGAIVKTIEENLLASFQDSLHATRCALAVNEFVNAESRLQAIRLGIGIHRGRTLVATQNGRLDYFGLATRTVHALAGQVDSRLTLSDVIFSEAEVQRMVEESGCSSSFESIELPGSNPSIVQKISGYYRTHNAAVHAPSGRLEVSAEL